MIIAVALRPVLPLSVRKRLVKWVGRRDFPGYSFLTLELLRDFAQDDPRGFHRFLWSHHLAYDAETYEISQRFGVDDPSRRILFDDILEHFRKRGMAPESVRSIFDVGCSLGYMLRFAETHVFPSATCLRGLDIDRYAVETGNGYLRGLSSRIELVAGDVKTLDQVMGEQKYDVVLCCGVLMYLDEATAARTIMIMLSHTRVVLGLICLADPQVDNAELVSSYVRPLDYGFLHNLDAMVRKGGGRVVSRRWTGFRTPDPYSPPYFLLAEPSRFPHANFLRTGDER